MNLTKKKTALLALALIALVTTVSAGSYFMISDYLHKEATLKRIKGIEITITDFPDAITIGMNYTFYTNTKNVLDQDLKDLKTYIIIEWIPATGAYVPLKSEWLHVLYKDATWEGKLTFIEQADGSLKCIIGNWTAPVGYDMNATITFLMDARTDPMLLSEGIIQMDIWVESPSFP